jgi:hypothetical protein
MARTKLLNSSGNAVRVDQSESADITVTLLDENSTAITEAVLLTLTLTIFNEADRSIINSMDDIDITDASIGTVATNGVVTIKTRAADNTIVDTSVMESETHIIALTYTWQDSAAVTKDGYHEFSYEVMKIPSTVASPTGASPGWLG